MEDKSTQERNNPENTELRESQQAEIIDEIEIEDLTVDGICGVY